SSTNVSDLSFLADMRNLESLNVEQSSKLRDASLTPLRELPNLTTLKCGNSDHLTNACVEETIAHIPQLRELVLKSDYYGARLSRRSVAALAQHARNLTWLELHSFHQLEAGDMHFLAQLAKLKHVFFQACNGITDNDVAFLA